MLKLFIVPLFCLLCYAGNGQSVTRVEAKEGLLLKLYRDNKLVGTATGFIIKSPTRNYLVTNYHVITNKKRTSGAWISAPKGTAPNRVAIYHNAIDKGDYLVKYERLYNKYGKKLWYENRIKDTVIDVVALPLIDTTGIKIHPVYYTNTRDYSQKEAVTIVGFPKDFKSKGSATPNDSGTVVSNIKIDTESHQVAFLDEATVNAMSGSPMFSYPRYLEGILEDSTQEHEYEPVFVGVFSRSRSMPTNILKGTFLLKNFMKLP